MRNLNRIFGLLLFFLLSLSLLGQEDFRYKDNSQLGVKIGGSFSSIALQPKITNTFGESAYSIGASYIFSNKKNVGIQLDILYNSRRWRETFGDTLNAITDLKYLQLPLITNISIGNGRFKYMINLGTYFAFNLGKSINSELPEEHIYYENVNNREEKKGDFGLIIGGGFRYFTGIGTFQLDARYEFGYQNIYDEDESGFRYSNMAVIQVGIYYYFINFKKSK